MDYLDNRFDVDGCRPDSGSRYGTTKTMFVPGLRSIRACP